MAQLLQLVQNIGSRIASSFFKHILPRLLALSSSNLPTRRAGFSGKLLFVILGFVLGIGLSTTWKPPTVLPDFGKCVVKSGWTGWEGVKYTFIFGDSWTSTSFDPSGSQPSLSNPIGNPPFPGKTSANATNWVGYLTTKYNASQVLTYNLASNGAALDSQIVGGFLMSISLQVLQRFMGRYANRHDPAWSPENTLFIIWAGTHDTILMNKMDHDSAIFTEMNTKLTNHYNTLLDTLYGAGARNFLFIHVPPLDKTYQTTFDSYIINEKFKSDVKTYNTRVSDAAIRLKAQPGTNVWLLETKEVFDGILSLADKRETISGLQNISETCQHYTSGTPTLNYTDPRCGVPVNEYFWLNTYHPTYPVHDVIAEEAVKKLGRKQVGCDLHWKKVNI